MVLVSETENAASVQTKSWNVMEFTIFTWNCSGMNRVWYQLCKWKSRQVIVNTTHILLSIFNVFSVGRMNKKWKSLKSITGGVSCPTPPPLRAVIHVHEHLQKILIFSTHTRRRTDVTNITCAHKETSCWCMLTQFCSLGFYKCFPSLHDAACVELWSHTRTGCHTLTWSDSDYSHHDARAVSEDYHVKVPCLLSGWPYENIVMIGITI